MILEKAYGPQTEEINDKSQLFEDTSVSLFVHKKRSQFKFFNIIDLIKKRASIFGIYSLNDKVELNQMQLIHLKEQLREAVALLLQYQNESGKVAPDGGGEKDE